MVGSRVTAVFAIAASAMAALGGACGGKAIIDGSPGSGGAAQSGSPSGTMTGGTMTGGTMTGGAMTGGAMTGGAMTGGAMTGGNGAGGSSGAGCADPPACERCGNCKEPDCAGKANATKHLCRCDRPPPADSLDLYLALVDCLCGADGMSGQCGPVCSYACTGMGGDSPPCGMCLDMAAVNGGPCHQALLACEQDQ